jgi:hypothetical protein
VEARQVRRGEFDGLKSTYRQYSDTELLDLVRMVRNKELKVTELQKLYVENKVRVPAAAVERVLYPKGKAAEKIVALETGGLKPMGAPRQVGSSSNARSALYV